MKRKCKSVCTLSAIAVCILSASAVLTGCNVTRTVTTKSEYWQRGDTSVIIQSKTIESYDATKRL